MFATRNCSCPAYLSTGLTFHVERAMLQPLRSMRNGILLETGVFQLLSCTSSPFFIFPSHSLTHSPTHTQTHAPTPTHTRSLSLSLFPSLSHTLSLALSHTQYKIITQFPSYDTNISLSLFLSLALCYVCLLSLSLCFVATEYILINVILPNGLRSCWHLWIFNVHLQADMIVFYLRLFRYGYTTAGAMMSVSTKIGLKIGVAAASYDLQRRNHLFGGRKRTCRLLLTVRKEHGKLAGPATVKMS